MGNNIQNSIKMIDRKVFCSKIKYQRVAEHECLNNAISDKKIVNNNSMNINLNMIKNIKNKNDCKAVDAKTLSSPWFCPKMSRSQATSILKSSSVGSFNVLAPHQNYLPKIQILIKSLK